MVQAAAIKRNTGPRYVGLRLSADEYLALPDDGHKYQVINGVVVMAPSPTPGRQGVQGEINAQLRNHLQGRPIARVFPDIDVRFAPDLVYRPDLIVVLNERLPKPLTRIDVVPDVIFEVLSPGSEAMDLHTKLADYERFGVREYWIVLPIAPCTIRVFRTKDGRLAEASPATVESVVLPGFRLDLGPINEAAQA